MVQRPHTHRGKGPSTLSDALRNPFEVRYLSVFSTVQWYRSHRYDRWGPSRTQLRVTKRLPDIPGTTSVQYGTRACPPCNVEAVSSSCKTRPCRATSHRLPGSPSKFPETQVSGLRYPDVTPRGRPVLTSDLDPDSWSTVGRVPVVPQKFRLQVQGVRGPGEGTGSGGPFS